MAALLLGVPSKFRARDGCGDGNIQAVGRCSSFRVIGDEQPVVDQRADSRGDAVTLVPHNDQATLGQLLTIDILAVKQGAIDGIIAR